MTLLIYRRGYPALLYFALIAMISMSKFDAIFRDLCKSPDFQKTKVLLSFFLFDIYQDFITPLDKDESFITPPNILEVKKPFLFLKIPYCEQNKIDSKQFIKTFYQFTGEKYDIAVKWLTKKVKTLFPLKDRNLYPSCKVYKRMCSCGEIYIGKTIPNVEERWSEHDSAESAKHLVDNEEHSFLWSILLAAQKMVEHIKTQKYFSLPN